MRILWLAPLMVVSSFAAAQSGTVMGHIVFGDTQRPARFASISLLGVPSRTPAHGQQPVPSPDSVVQYEDTRRIDFLSDVEGAFNLNGVAPGDYYIFGVVPGYLDPRTLVQQAIAEGADPTRSLPGVPRLHVTANRASQAEIVLQRGASINGHVRWDDGSPITRAAMTPIRLLADGKSPKELGLPFAYLNGSIGVAYTGETGEFHFSALPPGDYLIKASVYTGGSVMDSGSGTENNRGMLRAQSITVYPPDAFHRADSKMVTLRVGEQRNDVDITFKLGDLRTISGSVSSAEDHHPIASGRIRLEDSADKEFTRTGALDEEGRFAITYVPPGTYKVSVTEAADEVPTTTKFPADVLRRYNDEQKTVVVIDTAVTNLDFELVLSAAGKARSDRVLSR